MPLYEYRCDNCGEQFEVRQKFSDEPLTAHEKCGSGPVHRLISAPSFQFKGSGWYVTDYAKGGKSDANGGSGKDAAPDKSDKSDKKDASAPAAKTSEKTGGDKSSSEKSASTSGEAKSS
jgi:putative FmdB family regulatory protein